MNIFKEMVLSIYSYESYKEFLKNKKSKVFGFGVMLMLIYFLITTGIPFAKFQIETGGIASILERNVPDFELNDGKLWMKEQFEYEDSDTYICVNTKSDYVFYDSYDLESHFYGYSQAILIDSEKMIVKINGQINGFYFSDVDFDFSKEELVGWVPYIYAIIGATMLFAFIWMTAFFFFGVLLVALLGMIVASCMNYPQLTFGRLYLLGIYSRTLPLMIKAALSFLPIKLPSIFTFIINFGLSLFIIGCAIQKMKRQPDSEKSDNGNN